MSTFNIIQLIAIWIVPVLLAITVHETAHGWVAAKLGDSTASMLGRLTLNPFKHIDPFGTIILPALMITFAGVAIGYAKPVPVNWKNLRNPKRDMAIVAAAGPLVNLLMAIGWALLIRLGLALGDSGVALVFMSVAGIFINIILMVINMVPLPPLDGGRVATGLLPAPWAYRLARLEPYGFFILIALLMTGVLGWLIAPLIEFFITVFTSMSGLETYQIMRVFRALMGQ